MQTSQKIDLLKNILYSSRMQIILGIILLFACSQVQIPLKPVPITLQTLAVLLIGLTYKPRQACEVIFSYLLVGAVGAPIFAGFSGGYAHLMGPTGGYFLGFIVAAPAIAWLFSTFTQKTWGAIFASCIAGQAIIYIFGVSWLTKFVGFDLAVKGGLFPFILPGTVKTLILTSLIRAIKGPFQK